jgi:hypothetical protein
MSKLDELIAATLAASKPQGCWASRLKGDAAKYVTALREEEKTEERIRAHMNRTCNCE